MRVLITGATGFAGSHLVDLLLRNGHEVFCLVHAESSHQPLLAHDNLRSVEGNLLEFDSTYEAIQEAKPDQVYHLAGQASPRLSWIDPAKTLAVNAGGTANLLEALRQYGSPRVLVVTSADLYGPIESQSLPINEEVLPDPQHPYGISKLAASYLARQYWKRYELPVIEARPFNHVGPRQSLGFVVPDFASQLVEIIRGNKSPVLLVGNLNASRDFTDVRDVVRAYCLLMTNGRSGELYLISSGKAVSIESLLHQLIDLSNLDVVVKQDAARMRSSDKPKLFGTAEKLTKETGWNPEIPLRQSLSDTLEYWMQKDLND